MKYVPLSSRKYPNLQAIVSDEDFETVRRYRWWPAVGGHATYAYTQIDGATIYLHRLIANPEAEEYVDHINHDGLDNRRENLRTCTNSENMRNRSLRRMTGASGYIGVQVTAAGTFRASLWDGNRRIQVGTFHTAEEAARARDEAARNHYGEFARLNFSDERGVG